MKLDVMRPREVVDINGLEQSFGAIESRGNELRLGALVRMAEAADDERIKRDYPVIAQSLGLAASPEIRNRASLGGNVMQRTRCEYFRDTSWTQCNKRAPGSGCAALQGINRKHAVLGVSDQCIATHGGDFAQALISLRATVHRKRCLSPIPMEFQEQLAIHCDKALQVFGAKLCEGLVRRSDA